MASNQLSAWKRKQPPRHPRWPERPLQHLWQFIDALYRERLAMSPEQTIGHFRITGKLGESGDGCGLSRHRHTPEPRGRDQGPAGRVCRGLEPYRPPARGPGAASLNHPNIAAIYGVESGAPIMELVEGPTLAERIGAGPDHTATPPCGGKREILDAGRALARKNNWPGKKSLTAGRDFPDLLTPRVAFPKSATEE